MFTSWLRPLLIGALAGGVCVGGLAWGLKLLVDSRNEATSDKARRFKATMGGIVLGGQLFVALGILYYSRAAQENPLALGLGLIVSTFVLALRLQK